MAYIQESTGKILSSAEEVKALFPETIFVKNVPDSTFETMGVFRIEYDRTSFQEFDSSTQKIVPGEPVKKTRILNDGTEQQYYYSTFLIEPLTQEELDRKAAEHLLYVENIAKMIRKKRDQLLLESDWTQIADSPVNKAAWAEYRQALRDISLQETFPLTVVWPSKP